LASESEEVAPELDFLASESEEVAPELDFLASESEEVVPELDFLASESEEVVPELDFLASESEEVVPELDFLASESEPDLNALGSVNLLETLTKEQELPKAQQNRIILVARSSTEAYAYWEIDDSVKIGRQLFLRLYDVTDRDIDSQISEEILEFPCPETEQDYNVPIPVDGRDYLVELGYLTPEGNWFCLTRSDAVQVPLSPAVDLTEWTEAEQEFNNNGLSSNGTSTIANSQINLLPRSCREAYAYWQISLTDQETCKAEGGEAFALRLYDVTSSETEDEISYSMHEYKCDETDTEYYIPIPVDNRDYLVEIGYLTAEKTWLRLARSEPIHIPSCS